MSMRERFFLTNAILVGGAAFFANACATGSVPTVVLSESPKLGRPASAEIVRRMDITVAADGSGLPAGSGTVAEGLATYEAKCAACHGPAGGGSELAERLTGGVGSLGSARPVKTAGSYWPYAPTLFDYIRRAMPLTAPQSLEDTEVYGLVAYLLSIDGIVTADARLDAASLAQIRMPNREGFVSLESRDFDGNIEWVEPMKGQGK